MRLAFISDLHAEYQMEVSSPVARRCREFEVDALIVAGDLSPDMDLFRRSLRILGRAADQVFFLPGNHDLWTMGGPGQVADSRMRYEQVLPEIARSCNVRYLGLDPMAVGQVTVAGVCGWYDYSLRNRALDDVIPLDAYRAGYLGNVSCADHRFFHWLEGGTRASDEEVSAWMVERLVRQLEQAAVLGRPIVVVTHMVPHPVPVEPSGVPEKDFVFGFLGSSALGRIIDQTPGVVRLISGHWHRSLVRIVEGASGSYLWEASPLGYPHEGRGILADRIARSLRVVDMCDG